MVPHWEIHWDFQKHFRLGFHLEKLMAIPKMILMGSRLEKQTGTHLKTEIMKVTLKDSAMVILKQILKETLMAIHWVIHWVIQKLMGSAMVILKGSVKAILKPMGLMMGFPTETQTVTLMETLMETQKDSQKETRLGIPKETQRHLGHLH